MTKSTLLGASPPGGVSAQPCNPKSCNPKPWIHKPLIDGSLYGLPTPLSLTRVAFPPSGPGLYNFPPPLPSPPRSSVH